MLLSEFGGCEMACPVVLLEAQAQRIASSQKISVQSSVLVENGQKSNCLALLGAVFVQSVLQGLPLYSFGLRGKKMCLLVSCDLSGDQRFPIPT